MTARIWTEQELRALGSTTDLPTAGAVLGIGSNTAYALAKADRFPLPVLEHGTKKRVLVSDLLRYCGWLPPLDQAPPSNALRAV
jgi:hypothetical protein